MDGETGVNEAGVKEAAAARRGPPAVRGARRVGGAAEGSERGAKRGGDLEVRWRWG